MPAHTTTPLRRMVGAVPGAGRTAGRGPVPPQALPREAAMQHAARSRAALRTGLTPVPRPRTPGVTSLIDADALRVLHRAARALLDDLPALTDRPVALLGER